MFEWFKRKAAKREVPQVVQEIRAAMQDTDLVDVPRPQITRHVGYIIVKDSISLTIDGKP